MAYKQKINPRTGKFNLVGSDQEGIADVTSQDGSISVTEPSDGVKDLSVNTASGPLKQEFDTLHEIYNKYKRRPSGNIDTEGIENHWIFPQDVRLSGGVNLPMTSGSSQYGDWLLVAICTSGNNGSVDTEGRITLKSFSISPNTDPQLNSSVKFPTLDFRWRLLRGENATEPDNGVPPQLFISDLTYVPTEYKECKGQTVSPSAPTWTFDPSTDFMCICHKVTQAEYGVSKFSANAGYSYVYFVFLRHKIWYGFYMSLEFTRIVTGSPVQCSYWTNNYHYNAAMESPATATWNNVMKSPTWAYASSAGTALANWCQYCDRPANRGQFRDILCQTLFGETAANGVTALPTGTRVMAQVSAPETTGMTQSADNAKDEAFHNLAEHLELADPKLWEQKTWSGLPPFSGTYVWTDGTNIYYSNGSTQYVLDKTTSTWSTKTWHGSTSFSGTNVWTDGTDIYYSDSGLQYVLDKSTSTWSAKTWSGLASFTGANVWTDGTDIYYSNGSTQYVLNKSTSTWSAKTWSGLTSFYKGGVWTDGTDIYYSSSTTQYVLDKTTSTWSTKTWNGLTYFGGGGVWTDGTDIYYSFESTQYVLDKTTSTWKPKTWSGLTYFDRSGIWLNGTDVYYSNNTVQYALNQAITSESEFAFRRSATDTWKKIKMADIERYINARQRPLIYLDGYDFYMGMFPKRADFIMRGDSYNINFHITSFDSYTQDNPFRVFGNMSSDGGSSMYFEEGNGEGGGRSFSFGSWETPWHDWMSSLFMFEFWMVDSSHARLRVTEYPNGYDGIAGRSEVIDPEN